MSLHCARELFSSAVSAAVGAFLLWGTYRRRPMLVEPHIHPPLDLARGISQAWVKKIIPKRAMVGVVYLLGLAFVAGACLGMYNAVVSGSCGGRMPS